MGEAAAAGFETGIFSGDGDERDRSGEAPEGVHHRREIPDSLSAGQEKDCPPVGEPQDFPEAMTVAPSGKGGRDGDPQWSDDGVGESPGDRSRSVFIGGDVAVDPRPQPDPVRVEVGDDPENGGGEKAGEAKRCQDFQGQEVGTQDQIGRVREDHLCQPSEGQAVTPLKNPGESGGSGVGEAVENIEKAGKTTGQKKVEGAVGPAIGAASEVQPIENLDPDAGGLNLHGLLHGLGCPHVAASDAHSHNEESLSRKRGTIPDPLAVDDDTLLPLIRLSLWSRRSTNPSRRDVGSMTTDMPLG